MRGMVQVQDVRSRSAVVPRPLSGLPDCHTRISRNSDDAFPPLIVAAHRRLVKEWPEWSASNGGADAHAREEHRCRGISPKQEDTDNMPNTNWDTASEDGTAHLAKITQERDAAQRLAG
jgi:hypothetical protein